MKKRKSWHNFLIIVILYNRHVELIFASIRRPEHSNPPHPVSLMADCSALPEQREIESDNYKGNTVLERKLAAIKRQTQKVLVRVYTWSNKEIGVPLYLTQHTHWNTLTIITWKSIWHFLSEASWRAPSASPPKAIKLYQTRAENVLEFPIAAHQHNLCPSRMAS